MGSSLRGATGSAKSRACSSSGFPWGHSLLQSTSTVVLHGLQGNSLHHHGIHDGLQENLSSSAWSTSSFFTHHGGCWLLGCLTSSHSSLPGVAHHFLPFLEYVTTEALPSSVMGSALASDRSILELALSNMGAAFGVFSLWTEKILN